MLLNLKCQFYIGAGYANLDEVARFSYFELILLNYLTDFDKLMEIYDNLE